MVSKNVEEGLNIVTVLIGLYMIYLGWGGLSAPLLSGIAFILIGINHCKFLK